MGSESILRRLALAGLAALAVTGGFAATASASQVFMTNDANFNGYLNVVAAPGEENSVRIEDQTPGVFLVHDTTVGVLSPGAGCVSVTAQTARCVPQVQTRRFNVYLGDRNDLVDIQSTFLNGGGTLSGDAGNDFFYESAAVRDNVFGGPDTDTVIYFARTAGVTVSLNGSAGDGQSGEGDNIASDVENVTGGNGPDRLYGNASRNLLDGGSGADDLDGGGGEDTLEGRAGNDRLFGNGDAIRDHLHCGGDYDQAFMDLPDAYFPDCEYRTRTPIKTGHSAQIVGKSVRVARDGSVPIRLRCLKDRQGGTCKGTLKLARGNRTLGSASYSLARRRQRTIRVRLRSAISGRVKVTATANERARDGRPMTTTAPLTLVG